MLEQFRVREHMEVADCNGRHVGTVDSVDGDRIRLTRSDSPDNQHHYLQLDDVDEIDDNRVQLRQGAQIPEALLN